MKRTSNSSDRNSGASSQLHAESFWEYDDYRSFLMAELKSRSELNRRYSLRAFARDIGLSPSMLSLVLASKAGLSVSRAEKVAQALGFSSSKTTFFLDLVESLEARSPFRRRAAKDKVRIGRSKKSFHLIPLEKFKTIEEWQHFAIFVLSTCKGYRSEPSWIAETLGISEDDAVEALARLSSLGLMIPEGDGRVPQEFIRVGEDVPSTSLRKLHKGLLQKAVTALSEQSLERREFLSSVISIDETQIPEAKEAIRKMVSAFMHEFSQKGEPNRAYCFSVQLFDLHHQGESRRV